VPRIFAGPDVEESRREPTHRHVKVRNGLKHHLGVQMLGEMPMQIGLDRFQAAYHFFEFFLKEEESLLRSERKHNVPFITDAPRSSTCLTSNNYF
jgi:hypothetical protein